MPKRTLILLLVFALVLAACSGESPASPTITAPTAALPATATPKAEAAAATDTTGGAVAGCTVISPKNTPGPTEQSLFSAVTDKDWSTGPKDAAITLIEYSDFM
jgi:hypothetical protein